MKPLTFKELEKLNIGTHIKIVFQDNYHAKSDAMLSPNVSNKVNASYCKIRGCRSADTILKLDCYGLRPKAPAKADLHLSDLQIMYNVYLFEEDLPLAFSLLREKTMTKEEQEKFVEAFELDVDKIETAINKAFIYLADKYMPEIKKRSATPDIISVFEKTIAISYINALKKTVLQSGFSVEQVITNVIALMTEKANEIKTKSEKE